MDKEEHRGMQGVINAMKNSPKEKRGLATAAIDKINKAIDEALEGFDPEDPVCCIILRSVFEIQAGLGGVIYPPKKDTIVVASQKKNGVEITPLLDKEANIGGEL